MVVCFLIKQRLEELGLEQKNLAAATKVTESYISQLLTRKKLPPAPGRTDIYGRMAKFLKLPTDKLSKLADLQRLEELKRGLTSSCMGVCANRGCHTIAYWTCLNRLAPIASRVPS